MANVQGSNDGRLVKATTEESSTILRFAIASAAGAPAAQQKDTRAMLAKLLRDPTLSLEHEDRIALADLLDGTTRPKRGRPPGSTSVAKDDKWWAWHAYQIEMERFDHSKERPRGESPGDCCLKLVAAQVCRSPRTVERWIADIGRDETLRGRRRMALFAIRHWNDRGALADTSARD